jgi:hypothetical protein
MLHHDAIASGEASTLKSGRIKNFSKMQNIIDICKKSTMGRGETNAKVNAFSYLEDM